jgi:thioredoxin 1
MMASLVDQLAGEYAGRIKIGMVNVDEEGTLGEQHEVVSLPTMVLYQNGEILQKKVGALPKREIENLFKDVLY